MRGSRVPKSAPFERYVKGRRYLRHMEDASSSIRKILIRKEALGGCSKVKDFTGTWDDDSPSYLPRRLLRPCLRVGFALSIYLYLSLSVRIN